MDSIIAFAQSLHLVVQLDAATDSFFAGGETHFSVGFCWDSGLAALRTFQSTISFDILINTPIR